MDYKRVPFERALEVLRDKVVLPTKTWDEHTADIQPWAFTVSGIFKASALQEIQARTIKAIQEGTSFIDFKAHFDTVLVKSGISSLAPWRARLVLMQNLRNSYNAGRYREQTKPDTAERRPWAIYRHDHPIEARPHHKAIHNFVAPIKDPVWDEIMPSNGFNCRCSVRTVDETQLKARGLEPSPPLQSDPSGHRIVMIDGKPRHVAERGFTIAPGSNDMTHRAQILEGALRKMDPKLRGEFGKALGRLSKPTPPISKPIPEPLPKPKPKSKPKPKAKLEIDQKLEPDLIPDTNPEPKPRLQRPTIEEFAKDHVVSDIRQAAHERFTAWEKAWDATPAWVRKTISRMAPPAIHNLSDREISRNAGHAPGFFMGIGKGTLYLNPSYKPNSRNSEDSGAAVWRHEYGHFIDYMLGRRWFNSQGKQVPSDPTKYYSYQNKGIRAGIKKDADRIIAMDSKAKTKRFDETLAYLQKQTDSNGRISRENLEVVDLYTRNDSEDLVTFLAQQSYLDIERSHASIYSTRTKEDFQKIVDSAPKIWQLIYRRTEKAVERRDHPESRLYKLVSAIATRDIEYLVAHMAITEPAWGHDAMDLIASATSGKVSVGHAVDYYKTPGHSETESFANFINVLSIPEIGEELVKYLMPQLYKEGKRELVKFNNSKDVVFDGYLENSEIEQLPKVFTDD